ncbi:MAG: DUF1178 family protein [Betaproteobacteria bacterium]|nr:DUF1178 family protein [Betaproteobacteria bacterium]
MKVFDLGCVTGHAFEGWFASEGDYAQQKQSGLLECPFCASREINKRLSAPRLNLGRISGARQEIAGDTVSEPSGSQAVVSVAPDAVPASRKPPSPEAATTMALMQHAWLKAVRHVIENTEDVGGRFAEEARRIHYGESPERGIRGQTTPHERESLLDEGIEVIPLPMPKGLGGPLQ